jgi:hypothetical protein
MKFVHQVIFRNLFVTTYTQNLLIVSNELQKRLFKIFSLIFPEIMQTVLLPSGILKINRLAKTICLAQKFE